MTNLCKYSFVIFAFIADFRVLHGQKDSTWKIEEWKKNYYNNWGNVNDTIKTKFDFFMEHKSWGLAADVSSSFKKNSTFVSLRYFFGDLEIGGDKNLAWIFELSSGYNFHHTLKNKASLEFMYAKIFPLGFGLGAEHFYNRESAFYISPLLSFDLGFIALEYSRRFSVSSNSPLWVYPNNLSLIIRPRLFFDAYKGGKFSQYWDLKSRRNNK